MPRENSFSDSDGRSLTPDLEDEDPASPTSPGSRTRPTIPAITASSSTKHTATTRSTAGPTMPPLHRFRHTVRKVIAMHRGTNVLVSGRGVGAEPGVDPRRASADAQYGGIKQDCVIEVADYSAVRSSFGRMTNREFVSFVNDPAASAREPWVKVRWINIGGISWDVIKAVSLTYGQSADITTLFMCLTTDRRFASSGTRGCFQYAQPVTVQVRVLRELNTISILLFLKLRKRR